MSCWVAPAIAAELWGLSLRDIQEMIRRGRLSTHTDGGFSFVRLPEYSRFNTPRPLGQRPSTFSVVSQDESALDQKSPETHAETPPEKLPATNGQAHESADDKEDEMGPPPDEDPNDNRISDWRAGRQSAARRRKPPGSFHA